MSTTDMSTAAKPRQPEFEIVYADESHISFASEIVTLIDRVSEEQGAVLAKRSESYIRSKIVEGKAVIAFTKESKSVIGFCYIEAWQDERYVANSGLVVSPEWRSHGLGRFIKRKIFELSRARYPDAKLFGLTTNPGVMRINSELGYRAASFQELTSDDQFWEGCATCPHHDILLRMKRTVCLCTGMIFDPDIASPKNDSELVRVRQKR